MLWFLTDSAGFDMLKGFSPTDMGLRARHLYENYHVLVQECVRDEFEAVQAELTAIMEEQQVILDLIIIHCGIVYIGDMHFKRQAIQKKIVTEFTNCLEEVNAKIMGNCKVIWSCMVTEPIESLQFTPQAIYSCTTSVNSGAAAELHKKNVGIIKHSNIEPNTHNFHKSGRPKHAAKIKFLVDIELYVREHAQSEATTALSKLPAQWIDNTLQLQIKEARDKQKQLTSRIMELQKTVDEIRKTPAKKRKQREEREAARKRRDERRKRKDWESEHSKSKEREAGNIDDRRPAARVRQQARFWDGRRQQEFAHGFSSTHPQNEEAMFQQFLHFQQFQAGARQFDRQPQRFNNPRRCINFF